MAKSRDGQPLDLSPYERIKHGILDGTFAPGTMLVEASVAEWCGVSRTPVREALSRLEQDGIVVRTDRGMVVRDRTPDEILDLYDTRISLEVTAARFAAARRTQMDQVRLERAVAAAEELGERAQPEAMAAANREFHRAVWQASHNQAVLDLLDRVNLHLMRYPETTLTAPGRWSQALAEHRELLAAIIAGDAARAAAVSEHHFTAARELRLKLWADESGAISGAEGSRAALRLGKPVPSSS
jgi:DNA-binding GntR family transcriptional regulator